VPSTTAPVDRAPGWEERLGEAALERLHYQWSRIGYQVQFLPARRGYLGLTFPARHLIVLYVRADSTVDGLARNTAHELGHALDRVRNTAAMRAQYETIRGIGHDRSWYPCNACTDLATPAGDFAETFSYWLMGGAFPSRSRLAGPPDATQLAQLVPFFEAPGVHSDA
jgi:hypothetical protein